MKYDIIDANLNCAYCLYSFERIDPSKVPIENEQFSFISLMADMRSPYKGPDPLTGNLLSFLIKLKQLRPQRFYSF
jgi:hypothetical protein